ncbi:hypothetical protein DAT35_55715 [Vitiosangium sp. GDMCC 1.1324]|nr:hypothetical protein DAT35_55715 [Vitiosangium sp. GDMCC 1.1324]
MSSTAMAQHTTRCTQDDWLMTADAGRGRNQWAVKCNYIKQTKADYLNADGEYVVFINGCNTFPHVPTGSTCQLFVPADANAPCQAGLIYLGTCVVGCYTPKQRLAFNGIRTAIEEAYQAHTSSVTGLSTESTRSLLKFSEQPIQSFVSGEANEEIIVLETADGRRLEVTQEHPLVNAQGDMVRARTLKAGDLLLGADGLPVALVNVSTFHYRGKVWNVRPLSTVKTENILDAEGLLSGSIRFQNAWADDSFRLLLRDSFNVSGL